jgi:hypothetical protein
MTYGSPIAERCDIASHGWCNRVMIEQERLIGGDVIHEGWWHLQSTGPNEWRMWDHERKWKPDAAEFSIETPSPDKHELVHRRSCSSDLVRGRPPRTRRFLMR